jgi:hypothetical protein
MSNDTIPKDDAVFDGWSVNISDYVALRTNPERPVWRHIPAATVAALTAAVSAFHGAYGQMVGSHTPTDTKIKDEKRKAAETILRRFIAQYLRYFPVTDADRAAMHIPNYGERAEQ